MQSLSERGYIRLFGEVIPDFMHQTILSKSYDKEKKVCAELLIKHLVNTPSFNDNHQDILLGSFWNIMHSKTHKSDEIVDFLKVKDKCSDIYDKE